MKTRAWVSFWLVGLIWGSSFLFIRISITGSGLFATKTDLGGFDTAEIVFLRTLLGALGLGAIAWRKGQKLPRERARLGALAIIGLGNVALPFMLITWSEQYISSSLASVLQASAALFGMVVAHLLFADDRITPQKIVGLIGGFCGVLMLFSSDLGSGQNVAGMGGMVLASLCYAIFTARGRVQIQGGVAPELLAAATMVPGVVFSAPLAFADGFTSLATVSADALVAVLMLGLLNTVVGYYFFYNALRELGSARTMMVTYVVPVTGVLLGALVLQERIGLPLLAGGVLILSGIVVANQGWEAGGSP